MALPWSPPTSKPSLGEAAGHSLSHAEHIPAGKEEIAEGDILLQLQR